MRKINTKSLNLGHSMGRLILPLLIAVFALSGGSLIAQENAHFYNTHESYRLGKQYFEWGNFLLAQQEFDKFLKDSEPFPSQQWQTEQIDAAYNNALCSKILQRDDASDLLTEFIDLHGNNRYYNSWANYHLGHLFYQKKKYKSALTCFEQIFSEDLDYEELEAQSFYMGYAYFNLKQFDEALPLFHRASTLKGKHYADANYYLGYISFFNKDYQSAEKYFSILDKEDRFLKIIPYYKTQMYFANGEYNKIRNYSVEKSKLRGLKYKTEMDYLIGQTFFLEKDFEQALPFLKNYVDKSKKVRKEDLYQLAYTQYKFGKYEEAINNFLDLNTLQDSIGQNAMYHLGDCYLKTREKAKARIAFNDASKLSFDPVIQEVSKFNDAKLSYELGDDRAAINKLTAYISEYAGSQKLNEAKNLLAEVLENTNNYDEALNIIDGISNPSSGMKKSYQKMAYLRGVELYNDNKGSEARTLFNRSLNYKVDRKIEGLAYFWNGNISYNEENYQGSIREMQQYLNAGGSTSNNAASPGIANYTIGYGHFKKGNYPQAKTAFSAAITDLNQMRNQEALVNRTLPDATLRLADCAFMQRDYQQAMQGYNKVVNSKWEGADYAIYQSGVIDGLSGNYDKKIATLKKLSKNYPNSYYSDDALFQIATTYGLQQKYNDAIGTYNSLLSNFSNSSYYTKSLNQMALMHYNLDKYDQAIDYYDQVIKGYPNDPEVQNAIVGIKDVFISKGDSRGYFKYIDRVSGVSLTSTAQDSTRYQFAETSYESGDCQRAITDFNDYLLEFPNGIFKLFAHYYKGECLYSDKRYVDAKTDFDFVISSGPNLFTEKALDKSSKIAYYIDKDYAKAYNYYDRMYRLADKKDVAFEAMKGVARSAYELEKDGVLQEFATKVLQNPLSTNEDRLEMDFYIGEVAFGKKEWSKAKDRYFKVSRANTSEKGAIARYRLADIFFSQKIYSEARKHALSVNKETPNEEYWVVKALILVSDIDYQQGDLFQAKATLKSIKENYTGDPAILSDVDTKLNKILADEAKKSKLAPSPKAGDLLELDENN